ncbi:hypothetical protein [Mycetocola sp. JXN-3]|uniref:hypothetical protein n=1 Tax=Mycetocola sp. JXN-3 TaxID=2116510 RepID=UPI00165CF36B|nr:hypothetical protein [Mycetocola sp. JXN-3]
MIADSRTDPRYGEVYQDSRSVSRLLAGLAYLVLVFCLWPLTNQPGDLTTPLGERALPLLATVAALSVLGILLILRTPDGRHLIGFPALLTQVIVYGTFALLFLGYAAAGPNDIPARPAVLPTHWPEFLVHHGGLFVLVAQPVLALIRRLIRPGTGRSALTVLLILFPMLYFAGAVTVYADSVTH